MTVGNAPADDPASEESTFAATAVDPDLSTPGNNEDAEASSEWQLKFQSFFGPEYEKEMSACRYKPVTWTEEFHI
ncbi:hypothetical protein CYMTET_39236 [Cymbomonas tetramitiformis]|uniref:Uncharacterized protein n=1 Tax=Cymbomonas tetramitiformis TaxID=36881 RepID=A0AAE0CAH8_9CHLO|nr:hypothetical protein CYMTET_39236 [Cymbomonas tetramitiformis]